MEKRGTVLGQLRANSPKCLGQPTPVGEPSARPRAVTMTYAGAVAWPMEALWWLPFGEVDDSGTGDESGTRWAESGAVGLTKTSCQW
jgi:hypothetical protein